MLPLQNLITYLCTVVKILCAIDTFPLVSSVPVYLIQGSYCLLLTNEFR